MFTALLEPYICPFYTPNHPDSWIKSIIQATSSNPSVIHGIQKDREDRIFDQSNGSISKMALKERPVKWSMMPPSSCYMRVRLYFDHICTLKGLSQYPIISSRQTYMHRIFWNYSIIYFKILTTIIQSALFMGPTSTLFSKIFIKIGFHNTIYTFKNYFIKVFSIFSNKRYLNRPKE